MQDKPYSKREIDLRFDSLDKRLFDDDEGYLPRIERQTIKTNGRMNRAERILLILATAMIVLVSTANPALAHIISLLTGL